MPKKIEQEVRESRARCPRCGYDQRGVIAAWTEQCPLTGTCTECGLKLTWPEIIVPEKFEPLWCVEFVRSRRRFPLSCVSTFVRSFRPWKFWARLKMSQPIRWRRLAAYLLFMTLPFMVIYAAVQATTAVALRARIEQDFVIRQSSLPITVAQLQSIIGQIEAGKLVLSTADDAKQHQAQLRAHVAALQLQIINPSVVEQSYLAAVFEAIVLPSSSVSFGHIRHGDGSIDPYPAPNEIHQFWSLSLYEWQEIIVHHARAVFSLLFLMLALPGSFVLLPVSRRRAKVRWAHIARVALYSAWIPVLLIFIALASSVWWFVQSDSKLAESFWRNAIVCGWFIVPAWWAAAIRNYLCIRHAAAVAVILCIMIALMASPCLATILSERIVDLILD